MNKHRCEAPHLITTAKVGGVTKVKYNCNVLGKMNTQPAEGSRG
jgi:hypothetical protein